MTSKKEPALRVSLLGRFAVWRHGEQIPEGDWPRKKTKDLLKVLLTEPGKPFLVDQLVEALFPEADPRRAVSNVQSRISELRHVLEPALNRGRDSSYIVRQGEAYRFDPSAGCEIDTVTFEWGLARAHDEADAGNWMEAVEGFAATLALYRGDFLPEERYEEWSRPARERLCEMYLEGLSRLSEGYGELGRTRQAIDCCNKILAMEPFRESAIRLLMHHLNESGERSKALAAYEAGARALRDCLDAEPSAETQALRERITSKPTEPAPLNPRRVAVIPIVSVGSDPESEFFADGMTEELIYTLSKSAALEVVSQTSVLKYKGVRTSVARIGRELGVGSVVEGSVRKVGSGVRVAVQLIDVASDAHLWAEQYDRGIEDILSVQTDIARSAMDVLGVQLLSREKRAIDRSTTTDHHAHIAYLRGRFLLEKADYENTLKAVAQFQEALKIDTTYVQALAGLADAHMFLRRYIPVEEAVEKARSYAERALAIDPNSAEAHKALALIAWFHDIDADRAEEHYRKAIELSPNWYVARGGYADFLHHTGRTEEAIAQIEACIALDPLQARALRVYASLLCDTGRFDEAIEQSRKGVDLDPEYDPAWGVLVSSLSLAGHWEEAEATARRSLALRPERGYRHLALATLLLRLGRTDEALVQINECLENHTPASGYVLMDFAWRLLYARDFERAEALLLRAIEQAPEHIHPDGYLALGMIRSLQGQPEEARQALDRCMEMASDRVDCPGPRVLAWQGRIFVQMGELRNAQDLLRCLRDMSESQARSLSIASLLCAMHRINEVFEWLDRFLEAPGPLTLDLPLFPDFDSVRSDTRFATLLEQLGLPG